MGLCTLLPRDTMSARKRILKKETIKSTARKTAGNNCFRLFFYCGGDERIRTSGGVNPTSLARKHDRPLWHVSIFSFTPHTDSLCVQAEYHIVNSASKDNWHILYPWQNANRFYSHRSSYARHWKKPRVCPWWLRRDLYCYWSGFHSIYGNSDFGRKIFLLLRTPKKVAARQSARTGGCSFFQKFSLLTPIDRLWTKRFAAGSVWKHPLFALYEEGVK